MHFTHVRYYADETENTTEVNLIAFIEDIWYMVVLEMSH